MHFIDSAYERLAKTTPDLVKYVSTFVDMTQDVPEQSGIELGVFIVVSGNEIYYIPVVSKGGTVFPIDSIFIASESMFFPLTPKTVEKIINTTEANLGQAVRIPPQVVKNPNVRELVEPPKTGKYAYASTGMAEFLVQLPEHSRKAFHEKLASDISFARDLKGIGLDVAEMKEVLSMKHEKIAESSLNLGIEVLTAGDVSGKLPDDIVQQILQRGYGFVGYNASPNFAIEYDARNDGYTKISNAEPGKVYEVVLKDGTTKIAFVPPRMLSFNSLLSGKNEHGLRAVAEVHAAGANKPVGNKTILIFEDGSFAQSNEAVIKATTMGDLTGLLTNLVEQGKVVDAERFAKAEGSYHCQYILMTPTAWAGPFRIDRVSKSEVGTVIKAKSWDYDGVTIHVSPNMHGDMSISSDGNHEGNDGQHIFVNSKAALLCLGDRRCDDLETNAFLASTRRNMMYTNLMAPLRVSYDGLEFAINGKRVGSEVDLARELVVRKGIEKMAFEVFVEKAKTQEFVDIYMSKEAAANSNPSSDPTSYIPGMPTGAVPPGHPDPMPNRGMTGQASYDNIQSSVSTGDKSIVESTIISEFLNDPNMFETISTYLPDIRESIDKLGRSIFLIRLNVGNLSGTIEPEYLSSLMSSLRNTYKMLGDSYMRLENLSGTPIVEESEI